MDAVRAADHRGPAVLVSAHADGVGQRLEILQDEVARLDHLEGKRGVHDVGRRQAEVQVTRGSTDVLRHGGREGDDVVMCGRFDLFDAPDLEARACA